MHVSPVLPFTTLCCSLVLGPDSLLFAQDPLDPGTSGQSQSAGCTMIGGVAPYTALREADVFWERRVWRVLDLDDPVNHLLRAPDGASDGCYGLFQIIRHGLLDEGAITAYDPGPLMQDDAFKMPLSSDALAAQFAAMDSIPGTRIGRLLIKEDWIFDKQRSVMEVRIIGLAPMLQVYGEDGELRGHRPLFWLYYPECRILFSRWLAFVDKKDASKHSYEEIFSKRLFSGTIQKVSNMMDRGINEHTTGLDALLESDAIREQLYRMGFDLWHY